MLGERAAAHRIALIPRRRAMLRLARTDNMMIPRLYLSSWKFVKILNLGKSLNNDSAQSSLPY
jgi:hypothetical protein